MVGPGEASKEAQMVSLTVLGEIQVTGPHGPIRVEGPVQRRLLAALVARVNTVVPASELVDAVWGDHASDGVRSGLKAYVGRLRNALSDGGVEGAIVTYSSGYALEVPSGSIDAHRFKTLLDEAKTALEIGEPAAAVSLLDDAMDLWRGRALSGFENEPWAEAAAAELEELKTVAQELRITAQLQFEHRTELLPDIDTLIAAHPFRDRLRGHRMLVLYRAGRQVEALRTFQAYWAVLSNDVGVEPGPELIELERLISARDDALLVPRPPTRSVGDYELGEKIGEGAFSVVFRATQRSVRREVAVKQIRSELANRPEFIRRFEAEAQMVAALEHPYIVPLYDYWREPGAAYLVMRWLRRGTLESLLRGRRLDAGEAIKLVTQVGSALATAHTAGVVHRDVKSPNIFLDDVGNYYLGDFGIAIDTADAHHTEALSSAGSPAYASPEQLRRGAVGSSSDQYSLGIVVYEALTGKLPFPDKGSAAELVKRQLHDPIPEVHRSRPDVPRAVDDALRRATAKHAIERYGAIEELVAALVTAMAGADRPASTAPIYGSVTAVASGANPYKGLSAFQEADADNFFGRDRLVERLLEKLQAPGPEGRLVAAVGPSGSGKSSVVRAGVLPRIRCGAIAGSSEWFVAVMVPGSDPFEELEAALSRIAAAPTTGLIEVMREDGRGISRAVKTVLPDETSELLLVVDQFEELFTLVEDDELRQAFIERLAVAVTDARSRLRVLLTIRADFWDRPLRHPELARILETSAVTVTPLAADELERAIVGPAMRSGFELESGLSSVIGADVRDQPGALPLLQYVLTELFDRNVSGLMQRETYETLGGVAGALARQAEELYETASADEQASIRRFFSRLVEPGEYSGNTRRRVLRSELSSVSAVVVDRFGDARLLAFDRDPSTREPTVEVAHEALIGEWPRLREWLDEDRDFLRIHRQLTNSAKAWLASSEDRSELYRGSRLESAEQLLGEGSWLNDDESAFLRSSIEQRRLEADAGRRGVRRLRRLVFSTAIVAVLALLAGTLALAQWRRADDKAADAEVAATEAARSAVVADQRAVEAQANAELAEELARSADFERIVALPSQLGAEDPSLAALLAVESVNLNPDSTDARNALHSALTARPGFLGSIGIDPIGRRIKALDGDRFVFNTATTVEVWDFPTRSRLASFPIPGDESFGRYSLTVDVAAEAEILLAGSPTHTSVIDIETGATIYLVEHEEVSTAAISPDGTALAIGYLNGKVDIHEVESRDGPVATVQRSQPVGELVWSPGSDLLAIGTSDPGLALWDRTQKQLRWTLASTRTEGLEASPSILFNERGDRLVAAIAVGTASVVRVVDVATGEDVVDPISDTQQRSSLSWADDAETVLLASALVGTAELIPLDGGPQTSVVPTLGTIGAATVLLEHNVVLIDRDNGVEVYRLDGSGPLNTLIPLTNAQRASRADSVLLIAFDESGRFAATSLPGSPLPPAQLFDLTGPLPQHVGDLTVDGTAMATASSHGAAVVTVAVNDGAFRVHSGLRQPAVGPAIPFPPMFGGVDASTDGRRLAFMGANPVLYDATSGEVITSLDAPGTVAGGEVNAVAFSPDGATVLVFNGVGGTAFYDAGTGALRRTTTEFAYASPGPEFLGTADSAGAIVLRDPDTLDVVGRPLLGHNATVLKWAWSADGSKLATVDRNQVARVWDIETFTQLGDEIPFMENWIIWSPNGRDLAVPAADGYLLWNYDTDQWADIACEMAGRNLTKDEWEQFGPRTIDYRATCPQYPLPF